MALWDFDRGLRTPFSDLDRMRRLMNRAFSDVAGDVFGAPFPAVNLWSNDDKAVATCELPGVRTEDVEISVEKDVLTIRGSREPLEADEDATYRRQERGYGQFSRTIPLPFPVSPDAVEANYEDGILRITMPRSEASKPRQIEIT
ncbi:MAG: Hsp20/alpha crystallin family protein [Planctomycetota bacterium]